MELDLNSTAQPGFEQPLEEPEAHEGQEDVQEEAPSEGAAEHPSASVQYTEPDATPASPSVQYKGPGTNPLSVSVPSEEPDERVAQPLVEERAPDASPSPASGNVVEEDAPMPGASEQEFEPDVLNAETPVQLTRPDESKARTSGGDSGADPIDVDELPDPTERQGAQVLMLEGQPMEETPEGVAATTELTEQQRASAPKEGAEGETAAASGQELDPDTVPPTASEQKKGTDAREQDQGFERVSLSDSDLGLTSSEGTPDLPEPVITERTLRELGLGRTTRRAAQAATPIKLRVKAKVTKGHPAVGSSRKRRAAQEVQRETEQRRKTDASGYRPSETTLQRFEEGLAKRAEAARKGKMPADEPENQAAPVVSEKEQMKALRQLEAARRAGEDLARIARRGGAGGSGSRPPRASGAEQQASEAGQKEKEAGAGPAVVTRKVSGRAARGSQAAKKLEEAEKEWSRSSSLKHRFRSPAALVRYEEAAVKSLIIEKGFTEELMADWMLKPYIDQHLWSKFCCHQGGLVSKMLTAEFLSALRFQGKAKEVVVRGRIVRVTPERIARVLGMPPPEQGDNADAVSFGTTTSISDNAKTLCTFKGVNWQTKNGRDLPYFYASSMDIPSDVWGRLFQSAVWPTLNTTVNAAQAEALTRIIQMERVPLAHLLFNNLHKVASESQPRLCHPHLIRRLCEEAGVDLKDFTLDSGPEFPIWQLPKVTKGVTDQQTIRKAPGYPRPKATRVSRPKVPAGEKDLVLSESSTRAPSGPIILDATAFEAEPIRAEIGQAIERAVGPRISSIETWKDETEAWKRGQEDVNRQFKDALSHLVEQSKRRDDLFVDFVKERDTDRARQAVKEEAERRRWELRDKQAEEATSLQMSILLGLAKRVEDMSHTSTSARGQPQEEPAPAPPTQQRARTPSPSGGRTRSMEGSSAFDGEQDPSRSRQTGGDPSQDSAEAQEAMEMEEEENSGNLSSGEGGMEDAEAAESLDWKLMLRGDKLPRESRAEDPDFSPSEEIDSDEEMDSDEDISLEPEETSRITNVQVPDDSREQLRLVMADWKTFQAWLRRRARRAQEAQKAQEDSHHSGSTDGAGAEAEASQPEAVSLTHPSHSKHLRDQFHDSNLTDTLETHTTVTNVLSMQAKAQDSEQTGLQQEGQGEPQDTMIQGSERARGLPSPDTTQQTRDSTFDLPSLNVNMSLGDSGDVDSPQSPAL